MCGGKVLQKLSDPHRTMSWIIILIDPAYALIEPKLLYKNELSNGYTFCVTGEEEKYKAVKHYSRLYGGGRGAGGRMGSAREARSRKYTYVLPHRKLTLQTLVW